jgi:hypothetical protein
MRNGIPGRLGVIALAALLASYAVSAQQTQQAPAKSAKKSTSVQATATLAPFEPGIQPEAVKILKATSERLAAAKSMAFTVVVSEEGPSLLGPPLIYSTKSEVILRRPDKLRVLTLGDGPASEFYYDGKLMMAYAPAENLLAVADAPPTIDDALEAAYQQAAIYFPFTDLIVTDPYKDMSSEVTTAFYIGRSQVVGDTATDMVAFATKDIFAQIWVGVDDKLPRRLYAVYLNDPARLRHVLQLSNWELDKAVTDSAFSSTKSAGAARIAFKRPDVRTSANTKPSEPRPVTKP